MVEGQRRIGASWLVSIEGRRFSGVDAGEAVYPIRRDSYLQFTIERFF